MRGQVAQLFSRKNQRGDSLLEVMLAISVMSMIAVGSMTVMNRGNNVTINSLWRTGARAAINSQAELLMYLHENNSSAYKAAFIDGHNSTASTASGDEVKKATGESGSNGNTTSAKPFYLDATGAIKSGGAGCGTAAAGVAPGRGVWIDAVRYANYTDFYIKACWTGQHGMASSGNSNSVTIVRIYDK